MIGGNEYDHMTPAISRGCGVEVIYQEYNLIGGLSVAENICLGRQMHGLVNKKEMVSVTQELFEKYHININPRAYVKELSTAQQQLVEITKGHFQGCPDYCYG